MSLYFITGNEGKFVEAKQILPNIQQLKLDLPELQELDPKKVLEAKLLAALDTHDGDEFFIEDTCMHFEGLNGFPGPLIKWFHQSLGNDGFLNLVKRMENSKVTISAVIGYAKKKEGKILSFYFEGSLTGSLVPQIQANDFEWGNLFLPDGYQKTFGEMSRSEKLAMSHRGIALAKFKKYLDEQNT